MRAPVSCRQIDTDGSGLLGLDELEEALKTTSLSSLKPAVLRAAVANAPDKQLNYDGWKLAIKAAGGPTWQRMLFAGVRALILSSSSSSS